MDLEDLGIEKIILIIVILPTVAIVGFFLIKDFSNKDIKESEIINTSNNMIQETNGFKIETLKEGQGNSAQNGDMVQVHYVGTLENGTKFDSSLDRNQPFSFKLGIGQVIKGWDLGVVGMKIGEKRKLIIPSDLAYGDTGIPQANIPPKATLIFEVELLSIN
ncbi:MAG: FKBP-type peptidyl-prolyl cis-trans isomerase [bacterium]|nr:FKBP-type peptidyl-prolyl cis-trans isomerase [bacterium]